MRRPDSGWDWKRAGFTRATGTGWAGRAWAEGLRPAMIALPKSFQSGCGFWKRPLRHCGDRSKRLRRSASGRRPMPVQASARPAAKASTPAAAAPVRPRRVQGEAGQREREGRWLAGRTVAGKDMAEEARELIGRLARAGERRVAFPT